ncbi:3-oxoacyl-[acyl-carrier-protein] synthase 2 [Marinicauda pacifica]|uniref:3-oxoacyl-[acyl-carrier-protein] synthase 2 n=1 Tax=Marinicauda pacifica TaxID=1133559 RepID=A0A4S2HFB8_9PROT|nr:beta-ketoacyl-ACP synthase II [Marinicauda pacifica]TGY94352.1 beta-ketoacyl-[acyl-carrier-protein] synthase II [Marinicauda pacifica]GGE35087.1 3-oxoacyl-[acyl-carrier-protein] synthase 2 [Marinicauda pacifica]
MSKRRVVVTGLGLVTPLGCGVETVWSRLIQGQSGLARIEHFETDDLSCQIAGIVPRVDGRNGGAPDVDGSFDPDAVMAPREQKRIDDFILYAIAAADEALKHSGWEAADERASERAGVLIGSGIGGLQTIYDASVTLHERGPRKLSPFVIPAMLINLASGQVSIRHGLKGPNHAVVTACSTGAHAIGDAARLIAYGDADMMVAGGAESAITRLGFGGFGAARALSTGFNDNPKAGSRPYDKDRDGFVMGEGAGVVILEDYDSAKARGATIYGEVAGYGLSGDAYHITAPAEDGDGGYRSMKMALDNAGMTGGDIDYVNAHGTSTPKGDEIELRAVERLFGGTADSLVMSSTKSAIGHLLGAAGAVEAIFSILAMRDGICPPTLNLDNPSVETAINLAPKAAVKKTVDVALSNSFGFGGTNASVIFRRAD